MSTLDELDDEPFVSVIDPKLAAIFSFEPFDPDALPDSSDYKRKSEDNGANSGEKRAKTRTSMEHSNQPRLPRCTDTFLALRQGPAYVDKTRFLFQLPASYRYLLLRPPQFGKTTFLSTLYEFYDVQAAETFQEHFKPAETYAGHSQHLCLPLTFANLGTYKSYEDFVDRLEWELRFALESFLVKYATELDLEEPQTYLAFGEKVALTKVLNLVQSRGKTVFVGVDSYDAPLLGSMRSHLVYPAIQPTVVTSQEVAQLLDQYFWEPLQASGDVVAKLFVAGTLSLSTPALQNLVVPVHNPQSCCGFTEDEARQFAASILPGQPLDVAELRARCGSYRFSSEECVDEHLLHPQLLIDLLSDPSFQDFPTSAFDLSSFLLSRLPSESDVSNIVTREGLIDLIASGIVEIEPTELHSGKDYDGTSVSWSGLYHAGALSHVRGSTFRVANGKVLSMIHSRIDRIVRDRYCVLHAGTARIRINFLNALADYVLHDHQPLLEALAQVLRDHTRSFLHKASEREPSLLGVLELLMRNHSLLGCLSSELLEPILSDPNGSKHVRVHGYTTKRIYRWEVTTLTLRGIWQAVNPNETQPSVQDLLLLHEELCQDDEERVLVRPYAVWSESLERMETRLVRSFFEPEAESAQLIAVGGARVLRRAGSAELILVPSAEEDGDGEQEAGEEGDHDNFDWGYDDDDALFP
ncbi:hypothetical protein FB45DRAFT_182905 [Roridomyces roridus]|uniref:AAA-ATPase-like domain-containing protein n=1 Tax=Roridomyces roridus TaxID=1738132 RepID=A0AAD7CEM4_9AGAR|nr:hypothetical protein FB45DRAFT_182905 [Roridomyces roridus]